MGEAGRGWGGDLASSSCGCCAEAEGVDLSAPPHDHTKAKLMVSPWKREFAFLQRHLV